jgi:hypothetical protein
MAEKIEKKKKKKKKNVMRRIIYYSCNILSVIYSAGVRCRPGSGKSRSVGETSC